MSAWYIWTRQFWLDEVATTKTLHYYHASVYLKSLPGAFGGISQKMMPGSVSFDFLNHETTRDFRRMQLQTEQNHNIPSGGSRRQNITGSIYVWWKRKKKLKQALILCNDSCHGLQSSSKRVLKTCYGCERSAPVWCRCVRRGTVSQAQQRRRSQKRMTSFTLSCPQKLSQTSQARGIGAFCEHWKAQHTLIMHFLFSSNRHAPRSGSRRVQKQRGVRRRRA